MFCVFFSCVCTSLMCRNEKLLGSSRGDPQSKNWVQWWLAQVTLVTVKYFLCLKIIFKLQNKIILHLNRRHHYIYNKQNSDKLCILYIKLMKYKQLLNTFKNSKFKKIKSSKKWQNIIIQKWQNSTI